MFSQTNTDDAEFRPCARHEWGPRGARVAAERGDVLIVVDVLRFSGAVAASVDAGVLLFSALAGEEAETAVREGAEIAVHSFDAPAKGGFSLSPSTYFHAESGCRVVITSANGATCARYGESVSYLFVGGLVNARALGAVVNEIVAGTGHGVTVLSCGERWEDRSEEGDLRFALEDYLGAGAILSHLLMELSPDAVVCRAAFEASRNNLRGLLWECPSGVELREKGLGDDVEYCSAMNVLDCVPVLRGGAFRDYRALDK